MDGTKRPTVITKRVYGGTIRIHIPERTPEQEAAFWRGVSVAVQEACPGRRLIAPEPV